ncbi:MFS general substrate transporter, partial [Aureobasidium melanogenum]
MTPTRNLHIARKEEVPVRILISRINLKNGHSRFILPPRAPMIARQGEDSNALVAPKDAVEQETTPLLDQEANTEEVDTEGIQQQDSISGKPQDERPTRSVFGIISVLLIGVFVSQADTTLVFATYAHITSEFIRMGGGSWIDGSWIVTSFGLATCATQPIYGRLSQIFGRKPILQLSYVLFLSGTAIAGLAQNMIQMIVGRVIQGAGSAGMVSMVSILLTGMFVFGLDSSFLLIFCLDLVPLHEVAAYRSYVNVFSTVGRSCGGLIGGFLTQSIGWRWAFIGQCPLLLLSIVLVWWRLEEPQRNVELKQSIWTKLKRIDFVGAFLMSIAILASITAFDLGSKQASTPVLVTLVAIAVAAWALFALTENDYLLYNHFHPDWYSGFCEFSCMLLCRCISKSLLMQAWVKLALISFLLFSATHSEASPWEHGSSGNAQYWPIQASHYPSKSISHALLLLTPDPLARSHQHSCVISHLLRRLRKEQIAIATTGLYLSSSISVVAGVSAASAIFRSALRSNLHRILGRVVGGDEIARKVLSDVAYEDLFRLLWQENCSLGVRNRMMKFTHRNDSTAAQMSKKIYDCSAARLQKSSLRDRHSKDATQHHDSSPATPLNGQQCLHCCSSRCFSRYGFPDLSRYCHLSASEVRHRLSIPVYSLDSSFSNHQPRMQTHWPSASPTDSSLHQVQRQVQRPHDQNLRQQEWRHRDSQRKLGSQGRQENFPFGICSTWAVGLYVVFGFGGLAVRCSDLWVGGDDGQRKVTR